MKTIKYTIYSFLFAAILFTTACEDHFIQEVNSDQLEQDADQLVVHAFISPQNSRTEVMVSRSASIIGTFTLEERNNPVPFVSNAKVMLSDGSKEVQLTYQRTQEAIELFNQLEEYHYVVSSEDMPIEEGKTYTLTVSTPDGKKVTATTTVPKNVAQVNWELTKENDESANEYCQGNPNCMENYQYFVMNLEWEDPADEKNYYRVSGYNSRRHLQWDNGVYYFTNPIALPYYDSPTINDLLAADGEIYHQVNLQTSIHEPNTYIIDSVEYEIPTLSNVFLFHTDIHYYEYHRSLEARKQGGGGDDPFSEPIPLYSNIEGGYGVFGSYQQEHISVELPLTKTVRFDN